jgi:excinuclease ABC subunit B
MMRETAAARDRELLARISRGACGEPAVDAARLLPADFLMFVDESHISIPQVHGMWEAIDRASRSSSNTVSVSRARSTTAR